MKSNQPIAPVEQYEPPAVAELQNAAGADGSGAEDVSREEARVL